MAAKQDVDGEVDEEGRWNIHRQRGHEKNDLVTNDFIEY